MPACDLQIERASADSLKELLGDVIPMASVLYFAAQKIKAISDLPRMLENNEEVTPLPTPGGPAPCCVLTRPLLAVGTGQARSAQSTAN